MAEATRTDVPEGKTSREELESLGWEFMRKSRRGLAFKKETEGQMEFLTLGHPVGNRRITDRRRLTVIQAYWTAGGKREG